MRLSFALWTLLVVTATLAVSAASVAPADGRPSGDPTEETAAPPIVISGAG